MRVQRIQNYNNYNQTFGELTVTPRGQNLLNSWWHDYPSYLNKIEAWKQTLKDTKHFDLNIHELCGKLFMMIESKTSKHPSCEAPLCVYGEPVGNHLDVFGTDLIDPGDWVGYSLSFHTNEAARNAYVTLKQYQKDEVLPALTTIERAVDSVKILEQAYENTK